MLLLWIGFFALVLVLLALDLGVFHRESHAVGIREAMGWTALWMTIGLSFGGLVYLIYERNWFGATVQAVPGQLTGGGLQALGQYLTAYLLEKSLSVDNIFVISVIFGSFGVPARHQHRVLFWGIIGALVARSAMIAGGVWLVARFTWVFYIFGGYLAFTGIVWPNRQESARFQHWRRHYWELASSRPGPRPWFTAQSALPAPWACQTQSSGLPLSPPEPARRS